MRNPKIPIPFQHHFQTGHRLKPLDRVTAATAAGSAPTNHPTHLKFRVRVAAAASPRAPPHAKKTRASPTTYPSAPRKPPRTRTLPLDLQPRLKTLLPPPRSLPLLVSSAPASAPSGIVAKKGRPVGCSGRAQSFDSFIRGV
ncbi:hypothetical protein M758_UG236400 [Ceratodon purpureus]|nr:hypothetical protein M758_UG236400 [Ceratodon purpureus]